MTSAFSAFRYIQERDEANPALWNNMFSAVSSNLAILGSGSFFSGSNFTVTHISIGSTPPASNQTAALTLNVNSTVGDYIYFNDTSNTRSDYLLGSHTPSLGDGLSLYDVSGATTIITFSKQSVRFYVPVVGPVFDTGGALASTYNAAAFGGSDTTTKIQNAILQASTDGFRRVYIPASMYPYYSSFISFINTVQMVREGGNWNDYDVLAYGAPGFGSDSFSIQAAANAAAANRGCVYFPPGTYNVSTSITMNAVTDVQFRGPGGNGALISMAASGVTLLRFTGVCSRVIIRDLWLGSFSSAFATGGSIEITGTVGVHSDTFLVENVTCQNTPNPMRLNYLDTSNFNNVRILSSFVSSVRSSALYMNHIISTNFQEFLVTFLTSGASFPGDGVVIDEDCDTVIFMDSQVLGAIGYGIRCLPKVSSTGNRLGRFTNTLVESCTSGGFLIEGARDVHMASCHAAVNGGPGYRITGGDGAQIYDSLAYQNNGDGIIVTGGRGVEIVGNTCTNNGQATSNTYDGIAIASGTSGIRIANNRSGDYFLTLTNKQRSGLSIGAATDYLNVVNNDLDGNLTVGFFNASTGAHNYIVDSSGVTASITGVQSFASGVVVGTKLVVGTDPGDGGEIFRTGGHLRVNGYILTVGANGMIRFDNRTSSNSSVLGIFNQSGTDFNFTNVSTGNLYMRLGGTSFSALSLTPETSGAADLGSVNRPWGNLVTQVVGVKNGTNASYGTATLASGGVVVNTTQVATNDPIFLSVMAGGTFANLGFLEVSGITSGTSFTIRSSNVLDNNVVAWWIVKPK